MCEQYEQLVLRGVTLVDSWCRQTEEHHRTARTSSLTSAGMETGRVGVIAAKAVVASSAARAKPLGGGGLFGGMRGGFLNAKPAVTAASKVPPPPIAAVVAAALPAPAPASYLVVGGGGAAELALAFHCQQRERACEPLTASAAAPSAAIDPSAAQQRLPPRALASSAVLRELDVNTAFSAPVRALAWRIAGAAMLAVPTQLLANSSGSRFGRHRSSSSTGGTDGDDGGVRTIAASAAAAAHAARAAFLRLRPHLEALHASALPYRGCIGFVAQPVSLPQTGNAADSMLLPTAAALALQLNDAQQCVVLEAELALTEQLSTAASSLLVADTLAPARVFAVSSSNSGKGTGGNGTGGNGGAGSTLLIVQPLSVQLAVLRTWCDVLSALLRVSGCVAVRSIAILHQQQHRQWQRGRVPHKSDANTRSNRTNSERDLARNVATRTALQLRRDARHNGRVVPALWSDSESDSGQESNGQDDGSCDDWSSDTDSND